MRARGKGPGRSGQWQKRQDGARRRTRPPLAAPSLGSELERAAAAPQGGEERASSWGCGEGTAWASLLAPPGGPAVTTSQVCGLGSTDINDLVSPSPSFDLSSQPSVGGHRRRVATVGGVWPIGAAGWSGKRTAGGRGAARGLRSTLVACNPDPGDQKTSIRHQTGSSRVLPYGAPELRLSLGCFRWRGCVLFSVRSTHWGWDTARVRCSTLQRLDSRLLHEPPGNCSPPSSAPPFSAIAHHFPIRACRNPDTK